MYVLAFHSSLLCPYLGFLMLDFLVVLFTDLYIYIYGGQFWQELEDHFVDTRQLEMMSQTKEKEEK